LQAPDVAGASALITMPTGTGKTGVIATIATALPSVVGHRLVLTPWVALVRQMNTDLAGRFWERIAPELRPQMLPVRRLPPRSQLASLTAEEPTIYVATISAISVAAKYADAGAFDLADVFSEFGCVLVDEGHYEPAPEWSAAIRALKRPTILLTATPYRNDEKYFNVSDEWRFRFPHWQAEADRFLRKPDFVTLDAGPTPDTFVTQLLESVSTRFADDHPRVIVRCETADNIRLIVRALQDVGESVIGVHDTFPRGDEILRNAVPLPENCAARFWVHQNKLIEGIDDPEFKVLAFYDSLKNDRAIVQQIGRVLRNPTRRRADMTALVIGRGDRDVERTWGAYRTFDRQDEAESVATLPDLVDRLLAAQPMAFYYDRAYRVRIDLASSTAWENFAFPLRTRVFRQLGDQPPTLDDIERETALEWRMLDRTVYAAQEPDERTVILPFITASNSPLLRTGTFIELEFGYTVIRIDDDLLFLYDSRQHPAGDREPLPSAPAARSASAVPTGIIKPHVGFVAQYGRRASGCAVTACSRRLNRGSRARPL
jgi:superfamily II DNA or RNA helicase